MLSHLLRGASLLVALACPAFAAPADDCRNPDLEDAQRLAQCGAAIASATDARDRSDLLLWRGAIHAGAGDREAALADFAEAETQAPDWADPLVERAWLYHQEGDGALALAELARAREVEPDSRYALIESMNIMADLGEIEGCLALADDAVRVAPDDPYTYAYRGRCVYESGFPVQALPDYQRAIDLGLDEPFIHANLASALLDLGRPQEALPEARRAGELGPGDWFSQMILVRSLVAAGDAAGATAAWQAAAPQLDDGGKAEVANALAWELYRAGLYAEGLSISREAMALRGAMMPPGAAQATDTYAHLLAATGQTEAAAQAFLKASQSSDPGLLMDYAAHLNELGFGGTPLPDALRACAATGAACRLSD